MENVDREDFESVEKEEVRPHQRFTIAHAVLMVFMLVVVEMLLSELLSVLKGGSFETTSWHSTAAIHGLGGLVTAKAGALLAGFTLTSILFSGSFRAAILFPLAFVMLGTSILTSELANLMNWIDPVSEEYVEIFNQLLQQNVWGVLIAVGIVGPFVEEIIFRGVMFEGLRNSHSVRTTVLVTSVLFGLVHVFLWSMINAFLLGLFFAWLKLRTRSLPVCILAHSVYNSLPFILSGTTTVQIRGYNTLSDPKIVQFQPWWFDLAGIGLFIGGLWGIYSIMSDAAE